MNERAEIIARHIHKPCPTCGSIPGQHCRTRVGDLAQYPHAARYSQVGSHAKPFTPDLQSPDAATASGNAAERHVETGENA